jgi:hypothetical protein
MDPHILAHVDIQCPDLRHPKLKTYNSEPILASYENRSVAYVNIALHTLTLLNWTLARFVETGCFLIRFLTVIRDKHIAKNFSDYLKKYIIPLIKENKKTSK